MDFIKRFIAMFLAVTMMVQMIPIPVFAQELSQDNSVIEQTDAYKDGDFLYTENADGTVCISGYTGEAGEEPLVVRVPDLINGKAVTKIGEEAFAYNTEIKGIIVPASVTSIDNAAFYHCENLQALAFLGRCPATGFTIVEGDHNIKKIFTPAGADLSMLCAVIVNDIGEEEAGAIEIVECEDLVQLNFAFDEFIDKESVNNVAEEVIQNTDIESSDPVEDTTGESTECNHIDIWYDYDETHHWKVCDDCGYEFDRKEHYGGIPRPGAGKQIQGFL